jgi:hypothetical protein
LSPDDPIWHPTTFTQNRERFLNDDVMGRFPEKLMGAPEVQPMLSDEHLSVDGTLLKAWGVACLGGADRWAGRSPTSTIKTRRSDTDPDELMCRKSNVLTASPTKGGHAHGQPSCADPGLQGDASHAARCPPRKAKAQARTTPSKEWLLNSGGSA